MRNKSTFRVSARSFAALAICLLINANAFAAPPHLIGAIECDTINTLFGYHITPLGDQNNDGYDDLLTWDYRFRAYVYYGGDPFDTIPILSIDGVNWGHNVGDINGDGFDDIAMWGRVPSNYKVNVYFGGPAMDTIRDLSFGLDSLYPVAWQMIRGHDINMSGTEELISQDLEKYTVLMYELGSKPDSIDDFKITPANMPWDGHTHFGEGLIAGDFNGDAICDLAASYRPWEASLNCGSVYLLFGGVGFDTIPDLIVKRPGGYTEGCFAFGSLGVLENLGDINGDGFDDFIAGSGVAFDDTLGFIYFGGPSIDALPDITISEKFYNARLAGDLNGDGYNDLITSYAPSLDFLGDVYIYLGGPQIDSIPDFAIHNWEFPGWQSSFGMDCSGIGDFNGDGVNDFAFSTVISNSHGIIYIYSGWTEPTDVEYQYESTLPESFVLYQNYPNPFNGRTTIRFSLPFRADVTIFIYDILGRRLKTLCDVSLGAGSHDILWDGKSDKGEDLSTGVYILRYRAGLFQREAKLIILK